MAPHRHHRFRSRFEHSRRLASDSSRALNGASSDRLADGPADARAPQDLAADDLRFIRQTMERSAIFTAVPGWGMILVGCSALLAAWVASRHAFDLRWLQIWIAEAAFAITASAFAIRRKAVRHGLPWTTGPARKVALSFAPPVAAAALLTLPMLHAGLGYALPGMWLLLYGCGVITSGAFSVSIVPLMGVCFMALGAATLFLPFIPASAQHFAPGNWAMVAGFGILHIFFGFWIARRHGG